MNRSLGRFSSPSNSIVVLALALFVTLALAACGGGPQEPTPQPPKAASNVTATPGPGYITVNWTDNSDDEAGFKIMRSAAAESSSVKAQQATEVASVAADVTTYVDHDIELEQGYQYSVVAHNSVGGADQAAAPKAATVPVGVDLLVGTYNRPSDDSNGTIFITYFVFPESVLSGSSTIDVSLTGPSGWSGVAEYAFDVPGGLGERLRGFSFNVLEGVTAVNGFYQLTVTVDGATYHAAYELTTADFSLDPPTDIVATIETDSITVSWSNPPGAQSGYVVARRPQDRRIVAGHHFSNKEEFSTTGLSLEDGIYNVDVATMSVDTTVNFPIKQEPFGFSSDSADFALGDIMSPLCVGPEQVVTIPDGALLSLVRSATQTPTGPITCGRITLLETINEMNAGVASLEGLEYAANLLELALNNSDVVDITPIADLVGLRTLDLNINPVTDIGPLIKLVNLNSLHLCCTGDSFVDLTPLEGLAEMKHFNISSRNINDATLAPMLAAMPKMEMLWLSDNDISDGSLFTGLEALGHLNLGWNNISDIAFIADITYLWSLELSHNPIADFTPLSAKSDLQHLKLADVGLSDISFPADFTSLKGLDLSSNNITDISVLAANSGIGEGDIVIIADNALDLDDPAVMADIQALLDRGVNLTY